MSEVRLNKFISDSGICSRRHADKLILWGRVQVGKKVVRELGTKINPEKDKVFVDDERVRGKEENVYYILNKPKGYITTAFDPFGRRKVTDLVPSKIRVYPVGRLDWDSSGLLILTNDGKLAHKLMHPKYEKEKEYQVRATNQEIKKTRNQKYSVLNIKYLDLLKKGIRLKEGLARADKVKLISSDNGLLTFYIVLHQGWNRQIRRMCEKIGLEVLDLKRIRIGKLKLGDLREGKWRKMDEREIKKYLNI